MSLWEYGESNGSVSLMEMFDNPQEEIFATSELKMEEIIFAACRGGWPATLNLGDDKSKLLVAKEYVKSVYKNDISRIDGVKRNQKLAHLIMNLTHATSLQWRKPHPYWQTLPLLMM